MTLPTITDVTFFESDPTKVETAVIGTYQTITGTTLAPGDPVRLFLESIAYQLAVLRREADWSVRQNLLAYSSGTYLDHLGLLVGVTRLPAYKSRTTLCFSLGETLGFAVPVPAGTRITPDGKIMFATTTAAEIPAGSLSVDATAECQAAGAVGNGFLAGQVSKLVDPVAHVSAVTNTTLTLGGADAESDDHLRERIWLAPESFSSAGPEGAYRFWALTAHQDIVDVAVVSPSPVLVRVYPLLSGGALPSAEILAAVDAVLDAAETRPLTDQVDVLSPVAVDFTLSLTWWIGRESQALASTIQTAVNTAVAAWVTWQKSQLGRDLNPTELIRRLREAGAKRVAVASPVFAAMEAWQVAVAGSQTVTYAGVEDE